MQSRTVLTQRRNVDRQLNPASETAKLFLCASGGHQLQPAADRGGYALACGLSGTSQQVSRQFHGYLCGAHRATIPALIPYFKLVSGVPARSLPIALGDVYTAANALENPGPCRGHERAGRRAGDAGRCFRTTAAALRRHCRGRRRRRHRARCRRQASVVPRRVAVRGARRRRAAADQLLPGR